MADERKVYRGADYLKALDEAGILLSRPEDEGTKTHAITSIAYDSREIAKGGFFICKGAHFESAYLDEAARKGAVMGLYESGFGIDPKASPLPLAEVSNMRKALPIIANLFYDEVWRKLKIVGITGTKGKSTTAYYVKYILDEWLSATGRPASAILSGIDVYDGVISEESHLTTPETFELHRHFANAVNSGIEYLVMEVSSQALKYGRTDAVGFEVGAFLNIGEDHISPIEHDDFGDYFGSKLKLFAQSRNALVNLDIEHAGSVMKAAGIADRVVSFGESRDADVRAADVVSGRGGISFRVFDALGKTPGEGREYRLGMTGLFNVSNALAAIAAGKCLGIPEEYIADGLLKARASGRMEIIPDGERTIIVDYAHNAMSFEALFASVKREYPGQRVAIVFGCPGKKALGRRRELGTIAGKNCDFAILTEEDAGEEPVPEISAEIARYLDEQGCPYEIIDDREEAIRRALEVFTGSCVILITGKGRETRQKRGLLYIDTPSDIDFVEAALFCYNTASGKGEEK